jgi:hypothetical protein
MIRMIMNVMLSEWKANVNHPKKEKTASCHSGYSKTRILQCFSFGLEGFYQDPEFRFLSDLDWLLRIWISDSAFGFSSDLISYFYRIGYIKCMKMILRMKAREHSILS